MNMRRWTLATLLVIAALSLGTWAWMRQHAEAGRIAAIPEIPDLSRWPAEMMRVVKELGLQAREGRGPPARAALIRLEALYHVNGFEPQAERILAFLEQSEPRNARWPYLRADLRFRQADRTGTEARLRSALALDPSYAPGWIRLGDLLVERKQFTEAEHSYDRALASAPGGVRAEFAMVSFQAWHGRRGDPGASLARLSAANPGVLQLHELLAEMHQAAGRTQAAELEKRRAATATRYLETTDPWIDALSVECFDPTRLGLLTYKLQREGRWVEAEGLLRRAIQVAPDQADFRERLAQVHELQQRPAAARETLEQAVKDLPDEVGLVVKLVGRLSLDRRTEEALAVVRKALARWPQKAELHLALGFTLRDADQHAEAVPVFAETIRLDPGRVESHYFLGYSLLALGRREEALASVEKALLQRPEYPEALALRAGLAIEAGDSNVAEPLVRRLLGLRPDDAEARVLAAALQLLLGLSHEEKGDAEAADAAYRKGLEAQPGFSALLRQRGKLAWMRERWREAVENLSPYEQREPADFGAQLWLGESLLKLGQTGRAKTTFERGFTRAQAAGDNEVAAQFANAMAALATP